jgi:cyclic pyranopterin phosphate synthase
MPKCALPFTQLFLNPNGLATPCCYLAQDAWYVAGDTRTQSLQEIWNSEKMRVLRAEFLSGNTSTCDRYMQAHKCHLIRQDLLDHVTPREEMPFPMVRLDLMLNGQCNLECVMCGVWTQPNGVYSGNGFWEQGREDIFPYLHELDVKGGEPFIQRDIYRLIDEVSAVNPSCRWHFTTNGHYRFNEKLRSTVSKIGIVDVSVSIDSLDAENFARIRKKGNLSTVLRTLDDWIAYQKASPRRLQKINANFVVQEANWREVPAFYEFCRGKGIQPFYIILTDPPELSIFRLATEQKLEAIDLYVAAMRETRDRVFERIIRPLVESLPGGVFAETSGYTHSIAEIRQ